VPKYPFLTDEWMAEAQRLREEYQDKGRPVAHTVRMNQVVTDVPFGPGTVESHLDSSSGRVEMALGHMEAADVTVTLDYATARAIFVEGNLQAAMQAYMGGKIKVEGDITTLMGAMQAATPDSEAVELAGRIREITE